MRVEAHVPYGALPPYGGKSAIQLMPVTPEAELSVYRKLIFLYAFDILKSGQIPFLLGP